MKGIHDVIKHAKFGDDRLRGSGVVAGQISAFPIDFTGRPYNTLTLPCERVISVRDGAGVGGTDGGRCLWSQRRHRELRNGFVRVSKCICKSTSKTNEIHVLLCRRLVFPRLPPQRE